MAASKKQVTKKKQGKNPVKKAKRPITKKATPKRAIKKVARKAARKVAKKILKKKAHPDLSFKRSAHNPIIKPNPFLPWEAAAVFNPAALVHNGRIHLFYRALGPDGVSRVGYASSTDGVRFDHRLPYPVFAANEPAKDNSKHYPKTSPARRYDISLYASGGGWGGCEDPRVVRIDDRIYMTFNMFNGWDSMRVAFTSIGLDDFSRGHWNWDQFTYLSRPGDRQKNWVLFPEKIGGKFALFHNLDLGDPSRVHIAFLNELDMDNTPSQKEAPDTHSLPNHEVAWHNRTRSAAAPPIKTKDGWLLFYHAMEKGEHHRYKVGALLLDLKDPTHVLYRAAYPLLEPDMWYENDWKPGIVYANGAVVVKDTLYLYYGGGDKYVAVAHANLNRFLDQLKKKEHIVMDFEKTQTK